MLESEATEVMAPLSFIVLIFLSSIREGQQESSCGVEPQTLSLLWGSDADVFCIRSCPECFHGTVYWTLNKDRLDDSSSTNVNSTHTRLALRNFTHHVAKLQCHCAQTQQVLGGLFIRDYTGLDNVRCMWHYKNSSDGGEPELFTCTWSHHSHSLGTVNFSVLLSRDPGSEVELCRSEVNSCTTSKNIPLGTARVIVKAQTAKRMIRSQLQEFSLFENLKMMQPRVTVSVFSAHLLAKWLAFPALDIPVCCQVKHNRVIQNVTLTGGGQGKLSITDVDSCRNYTVSVRCAFDQAPWSDWSSAVTVLTRINKKKMHLHLWRKIRAAGSDGRRDVLVMWKPIPSACRGTFTFALNLTSANETELEGECGNSTCEVRVDQNQQTLQLSVFDSAALLVEESVHVPVSGRSAPRVSDLQTWTGNGSILVSWSPPPGLVTGYMVDWTHDGIQYHWNRTSSLNFTLCDLQDLKPYDITVTPLLGDETGGANSAQRVCSRIGDPGLVSINDVQARDTSAVVRWTVISQEACSGVIDNYAVYYGTDTGPELNVTVHHTKQQVVLRHLTPDTRYRVQVQANSLIGSSEIREMFFTTKRFDPWIIQVLSISGSVLILLGGLICTVKWRNFQKKPVPDPRLSSLAQWSGPAQEDKRQQGFFTGQPFHTPSESVCERVYSETSWLDNSQPTSSTDLCDQTSAATLFPEKPTLQSSSGESSTLLSMESCSSNPYRSQNSVDIPAFKSKGKQSSVTTYVTLDMFEDDEPRDRK
ncbi:interleukin-31 receptor subunit alpha-like [Synchiropus splendidus]|uniref:interleukin-31 receptor subunit alpha-like n=1 Tax=Synchiropus splendidus TaxID=270530 RepID=UPI00237DE753|nr:interleukin-31 receptor subunit alpha-like [Synchiropus splendidus]